MLFPELELLGVSVKHGPIELLLREHQRIKSALNQVHDHANRSNLSTAREREILTEMISSFIQLVESHAKKEESVLFEVARRHIPEVRLEEMSEAIKN